MSSSVKVRRRAPGDILVFLAIAVFFTAGCSEKKNQAQPRPMMGPVPVTVAEVTQKTVPVEIHAIGAGEAYSTVGVKSQVEGEIQKVSFTEGQYVRRGDPLFVIDRRPFEARLTQAQANLARDIAQAINARSQAERFQKLYAAGIVSREQFDQYRTNAVALDAAVRADHAAIETANIQLGYCAITSPLNGRTGSLLIHQGNIVKANDANLVVINQISPIYVDFSVPEQYLGEIKQRFASEKMKVTALVPGQKNPATGFLSFVDNKVDNSTGTVLLKATFANQDKRLWPGQFVNVNLILHSQSGATVVPTQAVETGQKGMYVYVVKPDLTVALQPVEVGTAYESDTVIQNGLQPGDKVVTDGQLRLYPGAKVLIKTAPSQRQESHS